MKEKLREQIAKIRRTNERFKQEFVFKANRARVLFDVVEGLQAARSDSKSF